MISLCDKSDISYLFWCSESQIYSPSSRSRRRRQTASAGPQTWRALWWKPGRLVGTWTTPSSGRGGNGRSLGDVDEEKEDGDGILCYQTNILQPKAKDVPLKTAALRSLLRCNNKNRTSGKRAFRIKASNSTLPWWCQRSKGWAFLWISIIYYTLKIWSLKKILRKIWNKEMNGAFFN